MDERQWVRKYKKVIGKDGKEYLLKYYKMKNGDEIYEPKAFIDY